MYCLKYYLSQINDIQYVSYSQIIDNTDIPWYNILYKQPHMYYKYAYNTHMAHLLVCIWVKVS